MVVALGLASGPPNQYECRQVTPLRLCEYIYIISDPYLVLYTSCTLLPIIYATHHICLLFLKLECPTDICP